MKFKLKRKFKSPSKTEKTKNSLSPAFFWLWRRIPIGNQVAVTVNGHVRVSNNTYDNMNRRKTRQLPGGQTEYYLNYDATGNLTSKQTFNGANISYTYDPQTDRLVAESGPGFNYGYQYDNAGDRVVMTDGTGTTHFNHDERDRITAKNSPFGNITYSYDAHENLTGILSSNPNGTNVNYEYDAFNRPVTVMDVHRGIQTTSYSYDQVGNLASETLPNGASVTYQYDALNHLTSMAATVNGSPIASYAYTLGAAGNRLTVSELSNRNVQYTYDDLYRVTSETIQSDPDSNNGTVGYSYDAVGNRQTRTSSLAPIPMQSFSGDYDSNDRLTAGFGYDSDGNTTSQGVTTYTYDGLDHLTSVSAPGLTESFVYDGDGNKVSQTVNGVTTGYLVDTANLTGYAQVLEELQGGNVNRVYTYGTNRISEDQFNGTNWNLNFYGYDGQGSVRYLTNPSGTITDSYTYDAFGNLISQTGTTSNVNLYDGEQQDLNTGFYNLRSRWMNPNIGRLQTMDSYEGGYENPLGLHKYLFVGDNPENNIDPNGYFSISKACTGVFRIVLEDVYGKTISFSGNFKKYLQQYSSEISIPDGVDVDKNINEAFGLNFNTWLFDRVWPNAEWDYKYQYGLYTTWASIGLERVPIPGLYQKLANLGNFNYGATGEAVITAGMGRLLGLTDDDLLYGAGLAEVIKNGYPLKYGTPWNNPTYGDRPGDQVWIRRGMDYFKENFSDQ